MSEREVQVGAFEEQERSSQFRRTLGAVGAIVWKDLAAELRSRELLSAMLVFALQWDSKASMGTHWSERKD